MRASLANHLKAALLGGQFGRLARGALRAAAARFEIPLPRPFAGPLLATFAITYRCPLACAMCDLPARAENELSDEDVLRFVDAIADLGPLGLGITGGEPLAREIVFAVIERAASRGIVTHLNTSGVGMTPERARLTLAAGVASVNVSIDHDDALEHDAWRGRPRAQQHALAALRHLADARERTGARTRIQAMMAVTSTSLRRVEAVRDLVRKNGADTLSILPVHDLAPAAATSADRNAIDRTHGTQHPDTAAAQDASRPPRPRDPLGELGLENSKTYLAGIAPFLAGEQTPGSCTAQRSAFFLDPRGTAYACTPGATLGHAGVPVTPETLGTVVRSGALARTVPRETCQRCWWNCHRELDIAIGALRAAPREPRTARTATDQKPVGSRPPHSIS